MSDQSATNRWRERAKLALRSGLQRADLDLTRGSYANRVAATLAARRIDTVLDVGANVGQYAVALRRGGYTGRIVSCEPLSGAFAELGRRAARDPRWTTIRTAVGEAPGRTTINVAANSFSSSLLDMTDAHLSSAPDSAYVAVEEVEVTTVADLARTRAVDPATALLKVDTQGFESQVLTGAGDLLGRFSAVQLEMSFVELYAGQDLFDDLYERLRGHGYRWHSIEPGISAPDGRLLQCDGLFVLAD